MAVGLRDGLGWLRAHLLDDDRLVGPSSVRVYVTGERGGGGWRELDGWPARAEAERRLWLAPAGALVDTPPSAEEAGSEGYRYDPADPTPSLGGPVLLAREPVIDNRALEARPDVLTFTTAPLGQTVEAIGVPRVELFATASSPHFDVFARVCDVDAQGASWNVCDALVRVEPGRFEQAGDGAHHVVFDLWPLGHRFAAGHRIRLQLSSGAHPRYARNAGTGEPLAAARTLRPVDVAFLRDRVHPSSLLLPGAVPASTRARGFAREADRAEAVLG
jgi:putative CocE/NonD family hydrolase